MIPDVAGARGGVGPERAWSWQRGGVTVAVARDLVPAIDGLTTDERACLDRLGLHRDRRAAWVRGRLLARRCLGGAVSVTADERGVPRAAGWAVGLAHDGAWTAAIVAPSAGGADEVVIDVVIDLVAAGPARAAAALRRVDLDSDTDPSTSWAVIECALKRSGDHVATLLGRRVVIVTTAEGHRVRGIGDPIIARSARLDGVTLAWSAGEHA